MKKAVSVVIVAVLVTLWLSVSRQSEAQSSYPITSYTEQSTVTALVDAAKTAMDASMGSGGGGYVPLTQMQGWQATIGLQQALNGDWQAAADTMGPLGYTSYWFTASDGRVYFLMKEATVSTGRATILIYPQAVRDIVIAAPHVTYDPDSHTSARKFFTQLGARALILTGTNKCNNVTPSGCTHSGASGCSGLASGQRAVSDMNHSTTNVFQAFAMASRNADVRWWFSIHSNSTDVRNITLQDGMPNRAPAQPHHLVRRLRTRLGNELTGGITVGACNDPVDDAVALVFCAANDPQARVRNGVVSSMFTTGGACTVDAEESQDSYALMEFQPSARSALDSIITIIANELPIDLPGTGE